MYATAAIRVPGSAARKLAAGAVVAAACAAPVLAGIAGHGDSHHGTTVTTTAPAPRSRPAAVNVAVAVAAVRPADIGWDGGHGGSVTADVAPVNDIGWDGAHVGAADV
jgi:hypothetical protein